MKNIPIISININHQENGTIETRESLYTYGTVIFSYELMDELIVLDKTVLNVSSWLAFIPKVYFDETAFILEDIFPDFIYESSTSETKIKFISQLQNEIRNRIKPTGVTK